MACTAMTLTGIGLDCGNKGGLAAIYITDTQNVSVVDVSGGEVTGITMASTAVTFKTFSFRKGNANFVSTGNRSDENGTLYYETVLEAKFNKMETAKRTDMQTLSEGNSYVIAKDHNGLYWLIGYSTLSTYVYATSTANTGAGMADPNQFTLTLTSMTPELPYQIASSFDVTTIIS